MKLVKRKVYYVGARKLLFCSVLFCAEPLPKPAIIVHQADAGRHIIHTLSCVLLCCAPIMQIVVICCKFPLIYSSSFYELFYFRPLAFCTALLFTELTGDFFRLSAVLLLFSFFFISARLSHDDTATSRARANWEQSTATNRSERRRHRSRIDNEILSSYKQITVPISLHI